MIMCKLMKLNDVTDDTLLNDIFKNNLVVLEDIQGSKIYINYNGEGFVIKTKSISSEPLNMIDLSLQNYYNKAFTYFNTLDSRVRGLLNKSWTFCFEYFPDQTPGNLEYNRIPKNNLVLTSICKSGKFEYTVEELEEYARLFDVDSIPVIFNGKLSEKVIEAIKYFINTSDGDLEYVFGEKSFAYFFYKILNPNITNSFLMDEGDFQKNLEKLIMRIDGRDISFELLNPLYKRISDQNSTEFVEIYSLILVNFLNFCQSINLNDVKLKGNKRDEVYIYLICKLFNMYLSEVKDDLLNFDFVVPEFFDRDKFRINTELITNKLTREYIESDKKIEYIFKVILGSMSKRRKKKIGIFTDNTLEIFNLFIEYINKYIDMYLNKRSETEMVKRGLVNFQDFFDVKYDTDSEERVYISDVYDQMQKSEGDNKKDKGIKGLKRNK
jgi:hypothetical protein